MKARFTYLEVEGFMLNVDAMRLCSRLKHNYTKEGSGRRLYKEVAHARRPHVLNETLPRHPPQYTPAKCPPAPTRFKQLSIELEIIHLTRSANVFIVETFTSPCLCRITTITFDSRFRIACEGFESVKILFLQKYLCPP